MTVDAANALLKTLEEPPPGVLFLLLADDQEALLPTIRSRCQALHLLPMSRQKMLDYLAEERGASDAEADRLYRLSRGAWVGRCSPWKTRRFSTSGRPISSVSGRPSAPA